MATLTQQQIDRIFDSLYELEEFTDEIRNAIERKNLSKADIDSINSHLESIESNTGLIADLLGG